MLPPKLIYCKKMNIYCLKKNIKTVEKLIKIKIKIKNMIKMKIK